jgi:hypothetical protein
MVSFAAGEREKNQLVCFPRSRGNLFGNLESQIVRAVVFVRASAQATSLLHF